jgi:hypothetical protein
MVRAVLIAAIAVAVVVPLWLALAGRALRPALVAALTPAALLVLAAAVASATAWGDRVSEGSRDVSNTHALLVAAGLALMAGAMAWALAALLARVRRGNAWARRR